jgi:hypothetical protein
VGLKKFIHFNKSFTGILGLITAVTILTSTSVVALTQYEFNCAAQGDIGGTCFYNPDNCGSSTGSSTGSGDVSALSGKDNIGKTINFFIQEGLTLTQLYTDKGRRNLITNTALFGVLPHGLVKAISIIILRINLRIK